MAAAADAPRPRHVQHLRLLRTVRNALASIYPVSKAHTERLVPTGPKHEGARAAQADFYPWLMHSMFVTLLFDI
jgi:hypothetical protein